MSGSFTHSFVHKSNSRGGDVVYEILEVLGTGGYGTVYKVRNTTTQEFNALKHIKHFSRGLADIKQNNTYMTSETQLLESMNRQTFTPNFISCFAVNNDPKYEFIDLCIVMQFISYPTLASILSNRQDPLPMELSLPIMESCISAIYSMHEKEIIHCDIKPENILFDQENSRAFFIDFGISKDVFALSESFPIEHYTPGLKAPEARGTAKLDIYLCGIVFYLLLTNDESVLFKTTNEKFNLDLISCPPLRKLIASMTLIKTKKRWSAKQVRDHLKSIIPPPPSQLSVVDWPKNSLPSYLALCIAMISSRNSEEEIFLNLNQLKTILSNESYNELFASNINLFHRKFIKNLCEIIIQGDYNENRRASANFQKLSNKSPALSLLEHLVLKSKEFCFHIGIALKEEGHLGTLISLFQRKKIPVTILASLCSFPFLRRIMEDFGISCIRNELDGHYILPLQFTSFHVDHGIPMSLLHNSLESLLHTYLKKNELVSLENCEKWAALLSRPSEELTIDSHFSPYLKVSLLIRLIFPTFEMAKYLKGNAKCIQQVGYYRGSMTSIFEEENEKPWILDHSFLSPIHTFEGWSTHLNQGTANKLALEPGVSVIPLQDKKYSISMYGSSEKAFVVVHKAALGQKGTFYFEATVERNPTGVISIGITCSEKYSAKKNRQVTDVLGMNPGEIGYGSDGVIRSDEKNLDVNRVCYGRGDTIGCGITNGMVFFTHNGILHHTCSPTSGRNGFYAASFSCTMTTQITISYDQNSFLYQVPSEEVPLFQVNRSALKLLNERMISQLFQEGNFITISCVQLSILMRLLEVIHPTLYEQYKSKCCLSDNKKEFLLFENAIARIHNKGMICVPSPKLPKSPLQDTSRRVRSSRVPKSPTSQPVLSSLSRNLSAPNCISRSHEDELDSFFAFQRPKNRKKKEPK